MSDFYGKNPNKGKEQPQGTTPWQQDPFAAYDDPAGKPAGERAPLGNAPAEDGGYAVGGPRMPDYSAWRRPSPVGGEAPADAPVGTPAAFPRPERPSQKPAAPAADYGTVKPLYRPDADEDIVAVEEIAANPYGANRKTNVNINSVKPPVDNSFAAMGANAPTRIARPVVMPQRRQGPFQQPQVLRQQLAERAADRVAARLV